MKELKIHVKILGNKVATAVEKIGFDNNSASASLEVIGILQNLIRIEQDKTMTQANVKIPKDYSKDRTTVYDIKNKKDGDLDL